MQTPRPLRFGYFFLFLSHPKPQNVKRISQTAHENPATAPRSGASAALRLLAPRRCGGARPGTPCHPRPRKGVPLRADGRLGRPARLLRAGVPRRQDHRPRQQQQLDRRRTELLPQELLPDHGVVAGLQPGGDARCAASDRGQDPYQGPRAGALLPQLLHLRIHDAVVAVEGLGAIHRLDGPQRRYDAAGHYGAGGRMAARMDPPRTHRRRDPHLLHRAGAPALAPHVEPRLLAGAPAPGVDRQPGPAPEEDRRPRTRAGHETRAARLCRTRAAGAQAALPRCDDHAREPLGRLCRPIPLQLPRPAGSPLRRDPEGLPRGADPHVRHRPYLRRRPLQRD